MTLQPTTDVPLARRPVPETALRLDSAVNMIELARIDVNRVLQALAPDAGLFLAVDLVTAVGHLKAASTLLDRSADQIEAGGGTAMTDQVGTPSDGLRCGLVGAARIERDSARQLRLLEAAAAALAATEGSR